MAPSIHNKMLMALLLLAPAFLISSGLDVPRRSLGYIYKKSTADPVDIVTLTVYVDFTCPDSKQAYQTLLPLADQLAGKNFELVVRSFSLPYHRNSHVITQAVHLIAENTQGMGVYPFLTEIYGNLNSLTTYATRNMSDAQVLDIVAGIAAKTAKVSSIKFKAEIDNFDHAARLDFKYACTRGVYEAPTFMVNDVVVDATPSWSAEQWLDLIRPLL